MANGFKPAIDMRIKQKLVAELIFPVAERIINASVRETILMSINFLLQKKHPHIKIVLL